MVTEVNPLDVVYGQFVNGLDADGNLLTSSVDFSSLSFQGLFGNPAYSITYLTMDLDEKVMYLTVDNPYITVGVTVQCIATYDNECWFYGTVVARDDLELKITVVPTYISNLYTDFDSWSIQVTAANVPGIETSVSTTPVDPYQDGPFTFSVPAGKFFPVDGSVLVKSLANPSIYIYARVAQYNDTSLILAKVSSNATESLTYEAWTISTIDGSPIDEHLLGIAFDTHTMDTGNFTFTIETGKFFPVGSSVLIAAIPRPEEHMSGIVTAYSGTTLSIFVTSTIGSGTYSSWSIVNAGSGPQQSASAAVTGFSQDLLGFGPLSEINIGNTVSLQTNTNKLFTPGSHIIVSSTEDTEQFFRGLGLTYDTITGALTIFVTDIGPLSSGYYSSWTVIAQDGPNNETSIVTISTSTQTIGYTTMIFQVQNDKFFPSKSSVLIQDLNTPTNFMYGIVNSYAGTALNVTVSSIFGTGTSNLWSIRLLDGPLGLEAFLPEDWGFITENAYNVVANAEDYGYILQAVTSSDDYGSVTVAATSFADYGSIV